MSVADMKAIFSDRYYLELQRNGCDGQEEVNQGLLKIARDLSIPNTLMRRLGHNECGIYAEVISGGSIGAGDAIAVERPELL